MKNVQIVDRSSLIAGLYKQLAINAKETAVIAIDMHRGHLGMDVATMQAKPEDAKRVIARGKEVIVRRYYSVPESAVESTEQMSELAMQSLAAAHRDDVRKKS